MDINSDINVLGGLSDFSAILYFSHREGPQSNVGKEFSTLPTMRTHKTYKRYRKAILNSILSYRNQSIESMIRSSLDTSGLSDNNLFLLFWNMSANNELFNYINTNVFFPAYYSGRASIRKNEVLACLIELKQKELAMGDWSINTIDLTASKYLTLLKKFHLLEGVQRKSILHHFINDEAFLNFIYWVIEIEESKNILNSKWLQYSLMEEDVFIEKIMQKRFMKIFNIDFTGNNLQIEVLIPYGVVYDEFK
jgi:hypothetical protein